MFKQAGTCNVILGDVVFSESRFGGEDPNAFDINIKCTHSEDPSQVDWWRGEMSNNYGKGNFTTMTQAQITMRTLGRIGFQGDDLSTLGDQIDGKTVPAGIKETTTKDGKKFYNVSYIGASGGNAPEEDKIIDKDKMKARFAALVGASGAAPTAAAQSAPTSAPTAAPASTKPTATQSASATTAAKPNPFAKR